MSRERIQVDDALEQLRNELSIPLPPHFESRVRARVLAGGGNRFFVRGTSTLALAAVLVIAAALFSRLSLLPDVLSSTPAVSAPAFSDRGSSGPKAVASMTSLISPSLESIARSESIAQSSDRTTTFEVLVPPDQAQALARLLAAARGGHVALPQRRIAVDPETGELLPPSPIEIAELPAIPPLDPIEGGDRRDR